jgi:hypothetical protein
MRIANDLKPDSASTNSILKLPVVQTTSFPSKGNVIYNTATDTLFYGDDITWRPVSAASSALSRIQLFNGFAPFDPLVFPFDQNVSAIGVQSSLTVQGTLNFLEFAITFVASGAGIPIFDFEANGNVSGFAGYIGTDFTPLWTTFGTQPYVFSTPLTTGELTFGWTSSSVFRVTGKNLAGQPQTFRTQFIWAN